MARKRRPEPLRPMNPEQLRKSLEKLKALVEKQEKLGIEGTPVNLVQGDLWNQSGQETHNV